MTKPARTLETFALRTYKSGRYFYSHKGDRHITAIANHENVKITTERMIAMDNNHTRFEFLTKVTIV